MAKIRQVGKLNIVTCNKENDLNGDNNYHFHKLSFHIPSFSLF